MLNPAYLVHITYQPAYVVGHSLTYSVATGTYSLNVYSTPLYVASMPEALLTATGTSYTTALNNLLIQASILKGVSEMGVLFYQKFDDQSTSNFVITTNATTFSYVGSKWQTSTNGITNDWEVIGIAKSPQPIKSQLANFEMETVFIPVMTIDLNSYGIRLMRKNVQTSKSISGDTEAFFDTRSHVPGYCRITVNGTIVAISPAGFAVSSGDRLLARFTKVGFVLTALFTNLTTGGTSTCTVTLSSAPTFQVGTKMGYYSLLIQPVTGKVLTFQYEYLKLSSTDRKNVKNCFVGDSITDGYGTTGITKVYPYIYNETLVIDTYTKNAGPSDEVSNVLAVIEELKLINAKRYFLMIGGNNILNATAYQADYISLVSQLKAIGATVVHLYATPRTATDVRSLNTWISATFPGDTIIDTFTPLKSGTFALSATYDCGDGTHVNNAGHLLIAQTIQAILP